MCLKNFDKIFNLNCLYIPSPVSNIWGVWVNTTQMLDVIDTHFCTVFAIVCKFTDSLEYKLTTAHILKANTLRHEN